MGLGPVPVTAGSVPRPLWFRDQFYDRCGVRISQTAGKGLGSVPEPDS